MAITIGSGALGSVEQLVLITNSLLEYNHKYCQVIYNRINNEAEPKYMLQHKENCIISTYLILS